MKGSIYERIRGLCSFRGGVKMALKKRRSAFAPQKDKSERWDENAIMIREKRKRKDNVEARQTHGCVPVVLLCRITRHIQPIDHWLIRWKEINRDLGVRKVDDNFTRSQSEVKSRTILSLAPRALGSHWTLSQHFSINVVIGRRRLNRSVLRASDQPSPFSRLRHSTHIARRISLRCWTTSWDWRRLGGWPRIWSAGRSAIAPPECRRRCRSPKCADCPARSSSPAAAASSARSRPRTCASPRKICISDTRTATTLTRSPDSARARARAPRSATLLGGQPSSRSPPLLTSGCLSPCLTWGLSRASLFENPGVSRRTMALPRIKSAGVLGLLSSRDTNEMRKHCIRRTFHLCRFPNKSAFPRIRRRVDTLALAIRVGVKFRSPSIRLSLSPSLSLSLGKMTSNPKKTKPSADTPTERFFLWRQRWAIQRESDAEESHERGAQQKIKQRGTLTKYDNRCNSSRGVFPGKFAPRFQNGVLSASAFGHN